MKKMKQLALVLMLSVGGVQYSYAQAVKPTKVSVVIPEEPKNTKKISSTIMELPLPKGEKFKGKINYKKALSKGKQSIAGNIEGNKDATFYLRIDGTSIEGNIILKKDKKAYSYTSDNKGTYVQEVDIESVLCIEYELEPVKSKSSRTNAPSISPETLKLQSLPGAEACVLIDFDGQYVVNTPWNGGAPINALPAGFTDEQILETFDIVKEDFIPFNINITTDSTVFESYAQENRMRVIVTPTNDAAPGWGGVAYIGSFKWADETPCWVFNLSPKSAGETVSHEIGHTLGLLHDGRNGFSGTSHEEYYNGQGNWAPIMGSSFSRVITQWSKGEYQYANLQEDDIAIIASYTNGFGYRNDDHGDTASTATPLRKDELGNVFMEQNNGIIEKAGDKDCFSFTTTNGGNILLYIQPAARHGNLNIRAKLYNSSGVLLSTSDNTGVTSFINTGGPAGTYYLIVDAVGEGNPLTNGYSDYGSLGYYSISGNVSGLATDITPVNTYRECNYTGNPTPMPLFVGNYTGYRLFEYNIFINDISSLKVKPGYKVLLYENDNFTGNSITLTEDDDCLIDNNFDNKTSSMRVLPTGNKLPEIILSSPSNNEIIYIPANISLKANAFDEDGTINKVEFYNGPTKLGEVTSEPFEYNWNNVAAGTYSIYAVVTDNEGGETSSYPNTITVTNYTAKATFYPNCNYTGTAVGLTPGMYSLSALNAKGIADNDIASLEISNGFEVILFKNDNAKGEAKKISSNTNCLSSSGFENTTTSLIIRPITANIAPDITITSPVNGSDLTNVAGLAIWSRFNDVDGYVTHIEYYDGSTLIGTATYPNYYVYWEPTPGNHILTAIAYDNDNAFTISKPIEVYKNTPPICTAPTWSTGVAYVWGNIVEQNGIRYRANWWNYNESPNLNNGPSGSGMPWTSLGICNSKLSNDNSTTVKKQTSADILIYPNPSSGSFTINADQKATAYVYNTYGNKIDSFNILEGENNINLSISSGLYIIKINDSILKLIIE